MRVRNTRRWGIGHLYPDREYFLESNVGDGLHTIQAGNMLIDVLVKDNKADTTLVFFHASVTEASTFPVLSGAGLASAAGVNLIAVSDPVLAYTEKVRLGWHIGVRTIGSFVQYATPVIQHVLSRLGSSRTVLAGSSGGGYAAMNFGQFFPDSIILCINPRLHLGSRPKANVASFVTNAFRVEGRTAFNRVYRQYITENVADFYPSGLTSDVALLQNDEDVDYFEGQLVPFVQQFVGDPRLWVRTDSLGEGHVPYPKEVLHKVLWSLSDVSRSPQEALARVDFVHG